MENQIFQSLLVAGCGVLLTALPVSAQLQPGWHNAKANPQEAATWLQAPQQGAAPAPLALQSQSASGSSCEADHITSEIQTLADGLQNDAWRIYEYCRNHISFEAYWGCKKGATLTYLEGSGNGFDTSALMVSLLKASGYTNVEYRYGFRDLFDFEVQDWIGLASVFDAVEPFPEYPTDQDFTYEFGSPPSGMSVKTYRHLLWDITYLLAQGYPGVSPTTFSFGYDLGVPHVWVRFTDTDGTVYEVDPSFKRRADLVTNVDTSALSQTAYTSNNFLSSIGGTTGSNYVQNINEGNLDSKMEQYSGEVLNWFKTQKANEDKDEFIYNQKARPLTSEGLAANQITSSDYFGTSWLPVTTWASIPDQWMVKLEVTFGRNYNEDTDSFSSVFASDTLNTACLSGRKFSMVFNGNTVTSYLDETIHETFSVSDSSVDIRFKFNHPFGEYNRSNGVWSDSGKSDQVEGKTYEKNDNYAYSFLYGFDPSGRHLRKRQNVLQQYKHQGLPDDDWRVRTELLNTMGLTWLHQVNLADSIIASRNDVIQLQQHSFGRMAQEDGFYVDVGLALSGSFAFESSDEKGLNTFQTGTVFASALEHALIEQMQGSDKRATSTVKIMQLANAQGTRVYRATPSNWSSIRSILNGNGYPAADLDRIESFVLNPDSEDESALIPASPTVALNSWDGTGYATLSTTSNGMFISGGFNGGYLSDPAFVDYDPYQDFIYSDPGFYDTGGLDLSYSYEPVTTPEVFALDPVDMASGAFTLDKVDLECGMAMPRGLRFSRHYNSNRNFDQEKGLGYGWTHNLDITATERSAVRSSMGEASIRQMAPYYTGIQVAADLLNNQSNAKEFQAAMLVAKWATDQLLYKGVSITMGNKTIEFVEMPDGSYEPPAGMSMTLTKSGASYSLEERHGNTYNFNEDGRVTTVVDQHGNTATFTYSGENLSRVTDSYSRRLDFTWGGGKITKVTETAGSLTRDVTIGYTGDVMTSFSDPLAKLYSYQYDTENRITHLRDPDNRVIVRNEYDDLGRVKHQYPQGDNNKQWDLFFSGFCNIERDPQGGETCYFFDDRGRSIGIEDQLGNSMSRSYDGEDHIVSTTTPEGETTAFDYNGDNNLVTITDPLGHTVTHTYDASERIQFTEDKRGNSSSFTYTAEHLIQTVTDQLGHITTYGYFPNGLVQTVTDAESKTTTTAYDSFGTINSVTLHDGTSQSMTNNPRGDVLTTTDGEGRTITNTWNDRRQVLTTTAPTISGQPAAIITNTYDNSGNLASRTDPNSNTATHTWNSIGNPVTSTQPALSSGTNTVTTAYDSRDWISNITNSLGHVMSREYDSAKRMIAITDPLNRRSENTFDKNGRILTSTDPLSRVTTSSFNDRGEMDVTTDAESEDTGYQYDNNGNRTQLTDRRGKVYTFAYDEVNRLTSSTTPMGKATTMTYFDNNLVKTVTEPSSQTTTYSYNGRNLVSSKSDPTGAIGYSYDDSGMLETVTEGADTISRTYDERGKVKTYTNEDGDQLQYQYDGNGNLTKLTYPDGKEVDYTYNERNLLETVTDWSNRTTTYQYDRLGRLVGIDRSNGASTTIERDAGDQIVSMREASPNAVISLLRFGYDSAGQISDRFRAPIAQSNFTQPSIAAAYDDDNRLLTLNSASVSHDDDGNMTFGPISTTSGSVNLSYNSRNQLTNAAGVSYSYDAEGHRRTMTDSTGTTRFTIDPNANLSRLLVKTAPDGTKTFYVYGLGLIYEADEADQTLHYHFDQVGSTIARTDGSGTVVGRAEYSAYGLIAMREGDMDTPFLYNGRWGIQTDENGLLNMRARYYSPYLMRFLNADPIGFSGGQNWFAYANGDPISTLDPFGLWGWRNALSLALDFVPVVSTVKAAVEVVTGYDIVAGEEVNRGVAAAGLAASFIPGGKAAVRGTSEAVQMAARYGDEVVDTTRRLSQHVDDAVRNVDSQGIEAFTDAQRAAATRNPNLTNAYRGNRIDVDARRAIEKDPALQHLTSNYTRGADFVDDASGVWWDMTTSGEWAKHVNRYGSNGIRLATEPIVETTTNPLIRNTILTGAIQSINRFK